MQVLVKVKNVGIMINVNVNAKNWLTEEDVKRDLHGILVIANVNVINHVMLENIYIMEIVNVERGGFISLFKNLVKILIEMKWFIMPL